MICPERRKYKRMDKPVMVRFRTIPLVAEKMVSADWDMVPVKNLSAGGMLFDYNKNLELDSLLNFKIDISKSTPTINCVGKVTRIEQFKPTSVFTIAIKFIDIGNYFLKVINSATTTTQAPTTVPAVCLGPKPGLNPIPIRSATNDSTKITVPTTSKMMATFFLPFICFSSYISFF